MIQPSSRKIFLLISLLVFGLLLSTQDISYAASNISTAEEMANIGTNDSFQTNLTTISKGIVTIARTISVIFIALGGIMVAFNVESANKLLWNAMLGIGLALNTFFVINSLFGNLVLNPATTPVLDFQFDLAGDNDHWYTFPTDFTGKYEKFCKAGAAAIMPIAVKLLLVLTAINASIKVSLGLISGDKIKFLVETCLTTGFYLFLIMNWFNGDGTLNGVAQSNGMNLMGSLMEGFRNIGYKAGGLQGEAVQGDVIGMGCKMFLAGIGASSGKSWIDTITSPVMTLGTFLALGAMVILLFLTGLEMVMARIEFVTLAMISVIMIPWGALKQTNFLFTSTLNAMFSQAIKVSVISFIEVMSCTVLTGYCEKFTEQAKSGKFFGDWTLILQVVMISIMLFFITKKIPDLVSSLINGQPQLGAAGMVDTAKNVSHAAVKGGAAAATGGAAVAAAGIQGARVAGGAAAGKAAAGGASAAGIAAAGIKGGALGALNVMGGAAVSGTAGLAKRSLLGTKNQDGRRSGGLLSGAVNAALQGKDIGQAYMPKKGKEGRLSTKVPSLEDAKTAVGKAAYAVQHPAKTVANAVKNTQTVSNTQQAFRISKALHKNKDKQ